MISLALHLVVCIALCVGCSTKSPLYFQTKGRVVTSQLLEHLEDVHDLDDLIEILPRLQMLFDQLVDVMIEARKWQVKEGVEWGPSEEDAALSARLCSELNRIFAIPAARDLIEKSQHRALERLDAFETKVNKNARN
ncbi:MAG: hypothetical protein JSR46_00100 [Verrucomicrobia bacterium]|nr:hypothetical protein [Verrucomicrobiota bacterium]